MEVSREKLICEGGIFPWNTMEPITFYHSSFGYNIGTPNILPFGYGLYNPFLVILAKDGTTNTSGVYKYLSLPSLPFLSTKVAE